MRLRFVFTSLQIAATLLVLWLPWAPKPHELHVRLNDGRESKTWVIVTPYAIDWAEAMDLPAMPIVSPVLDTIQEKLFGYFEAAEFLALWVVGVLCWYMIGRFADDFVRWRRNKALPRLGGGDLIFALLLAPSAVLPAIAFLSTNNAGSLLSGWSVAWLVIAFATLIFRVAQSIHQWHKPPIA